MAPPSIETSTPPTTPPPVSAAVPDSNGVPGCTVSPEAGEVMVETGGVVSVDADAGSNPACSVTGWTPMSANRFTVACCMLGSVVRVRRCNRRRAGRIQSPGPLHRPGAKYQGAAGRPVQSQVMSRRAGAVEAAIVEQVVGRSGCRWRSRGGTGRRDGSHCPRPRPIRSPSAAEQGPGLPGGWLATAVLRQKRILPSAAGI